LKGHRIRVDVTSSNFPRFDINPNSGSTLYQPSDTFIVYNTLYTGGDVSSSVELPVASSAAVKQIDEQTFSVYPNPCGDRITVDYYGETLTSTQWELWDCMGRVVRAGDHEMERGANSLVIQMATLPPGAYYLRFSGHKTGSMRVLKGLGP
jgi:hypothetical protein